MRWPLAVVLLAGCTAQPDLLENGGFETDEAWFWFEDSESWAAPFTFDNGTAFAGERSLRTRLVSEPGHGATAIVGAIQEVPGRATLPGTLRGAYHVDAWTSDAQRAYIQVVLSFFATQRPQACPIDPSHPCQLAIILAGQDERPFPIGNRIFVLPADAQVVTGEWVEFEYDVESLMQQAWGVTRLDHAHMWFYLEARYENDQARASDVELDVRWDAVSLGR